MKETPPPIQENEQSDKPNMSNVTLKREKGLYFFKNIRVVRDEKGCGNVSRLKKAKDT